MVKKGATGTAIVEDVPLEVDADAVARVHGVEAAEDDLEDLPATAPCQGQGLAAEEDSREEDLDQGPSEGILETGTNAILDHVKLKIF